MESRVVRHPIPSISPERQQSPASPAAKEELTSALKSLAINDIGGRYFRGVVAPFDKNQRWFPTPGVEAPQERRRVLLACLLDGVDRTAIKSEQLAEFERMVLTVTEGPSTETRMLRVPNEEYAEVRVGYQGGQEGLQIAF